MFNKIIFFGQGPHAECVYNWSNKNKIDFVFITSPRLKKQKELKTIFSSKAKIFIKKTLELTFLEKIVDKRTIAISAGSPFIFTQNIINLFNHKIYNLHDAPLPEFRGGASISWMILLGIKKWKSTIHEVDAGVDTGKILMEKVFSFPKGLKKPSDFREYQWKLDLLLLINFLDKLYSSKKMIMMKQNESNACYYPRLNAEKNGWINFNWEANYIERFIFAFSHDYGGARCYISNNLIKIFSAVTVNKNLKSYHPFLNGLVLNKTDKSSLLVVTGKGLIIIKEYESKYIIKVGDRLYAPQKKLEDSLVSRVRYVP